MKDILDAVRLADKLESSFKAVADALGAEKAFYVFAGQVVEQGLDFETERTFVEIIRATYDEYVKAASA